VVYTFQQPVALWALLLIPLLLWPAWRRLRGTMDGLRSGTIVALRGLLLVALVFLLARPAGRTEHDRLTVIGLIDVSDSVRRLAPVPPRPGAGAGERGFDGNGPPRGDADAASRRPIRTPIEHVEWWFREATRGLGPEDRFGAIVFDGVAYAVAAPAARGMTRDLVFDYRLEEGTDIAEALRFGLALLGPETAGRLVLASDGRPTRGDIDEALLELAAAGGPEDLDAAVAGPGPTLVRGRVPVDIIPLRYDVDREISIERVEVPAYARPDERITVRVLVRSTTATTGRLHVVQEDRELDINGRAPGLSRPVALEPGMNVVLVTTTLGSAAVTRFEAWFEPDEPGHDVLAENNRAEAFSIAPSRGSVLVIDGVYEGAGGVLPAVLEEAGFFVRRIGPSAVPDNPLELQGYDLIVLQNVAADDLAERHHERLARYVEDLGGGLVMVGGYDSFGAGGWVDTALAPVMPVDMRVPEEMRVPTAAIAIVLDNSGSMDFPVLGTRRSQQEIANEGAALAIRSLDEHDWITVITFNMTASTIVPLRRVEDPEPIIREVESIGSGGGTNMAPGLEAAFEALNDVEADIKHVICLSDGQSTPADFRAIAARMKASGITLSAIAVGDDADRETLEMLAATGGGSFYLVRNPRVLPRIFVKDIRIIRRPLIRETPFTIPRCPRWADWSSPG